MSRLAGKCAVVTGGRQGIGRAIVEAFLREGAEVMTCGRGDRGDLPAAVHWRTTDVSDRSEVEALLAAAQDAFGQVTTLVNNSGVQIEKPVTETTDEDWDTLMGVNAKGVFLTCRAFICANNDDLSWGRR